MGAASPSAPKMLIDGELDEEQSKLLLDPTPEYEQKWIETFLTVPAVEGGIVDFRLFPQQKMMLENRTGRDITVKGRQTRASSLILARNMRKMTTSGGLKCLIMTQDDATTSTFRERIRHHFADLSRHGLEYKIDYSSEDEMIIGELENRFQFASGEQRTAGRAYTANVVHLSEFAHYPDAKARSLLGAIKPAMPGPPTGQCDIESTPNGAAGMFYDEIMDSQTYNPNSLWSTHLYPWWFEPRYRVGTEANLDIIIPEKRWQEMLQQFRATAEEKRLMDVANLEIGHILWRRITKREQDKTDQPFAQEYPEDLDGCFILASGNYFSSPDGVNHLEPYRQTVRQPQTSNMLESLPFRGGQVNFNGPNLVVWQTPQVGEPYVLWADCAGGGLDERADYSAVCVLNARTMTTVARLNLKVAPNEFAPMVAAIAQWYNTALLGGERDAFGSVCVSEIQRLGYSNIWYYVNPADQNTITIKDKVIEPWAHPTQIRNQSLTTLRAMVFSGVFNLLDPLMFKQFGSFTWMKVVGKREGLKAAGKPGQKDDLVICAAGACMIATKQRARYAAQEVKLRADVIVVTTGGVVQRKQNGRGSKPWLR